MILASSNAILAHLLLDPGVWPDWQREGGADAPTDVSTSSNTGRVSDIIALAIDNSGMTKTYVIEFKHTSNTRMISLLRRWINEYGDDEDPDLDQQLEELRSNRLAFREPC
jgi:hypothetical protein